MKATLEVALALPQTLLTLSMALSFITLGGYIIHVIANQGPGGQPLYGWNEPWYFVVPFTEALLAIILAPPAALAAGLLGLAAGLRDYVRQRKNAGKAESQQPE